MEALRPILCGGKNGPCCPDHPERLANNRLAFSFELRQSGEEAEIRIPLNFRFEKNTLYQADFLLHPIGAGTLLAGIALNGKRPEKFFEWDLSGAWAERWVQADFSFEADVPCGSGSIVLRPGVTGFPRKIELTSARITGGAELRGCTGWKIACFDKRLSDIPDPGSDACKISSGCTWDFAEETGHFLPQDSTAFLETTVISEEDKLVCLPLSADYYISLFRNGELLKTGTGDCQFFAVPLAKGENRISILCRAGQNGWALKLGRGALGFHTVPWHPALPVDCIVSELYPWPDKHKMPLSGGWELAQYRFTGSENDSFPELAGLQWIRTESTGEIHTLLCRAGKIEDPFCALNSKKCRWIEETSWIFRKRFPFRKESSFRKITLALENADYYAHYWLNGFYLGYSEGSVCGVSADVTSCLQDENELIVRLECAGEMRGTARQDSAFPLLKGHIHAGWNIGDNLDFNSVGLLSVPALIWEDGDVSLERPYVRTRAVSGHAAEMEISIELRQHCRPRKKYELRFTGSGFSIPPMEFVLSAEMSIFSVPFAIPEPRLWWPNGMGEQNLYTMTVSLWSDGRKVDERSVTFGVRLLERRQGRAVKNNASGALWKEVNPYTTEMRDRGDYTSGDWNFYLNGRPFFVKGCNWMPHDIFHNTAPEQYRHSLFAVKSAGFQMLRVWGGGDFETDLFYELCDRYGILVMQDFPVNITGRGKNTHLWERALTWHICRLRNHPSLAVWCGGNEFAPDTRETAPLSVIASMLVKNLDPAREFLEGSPVYGDFHIYSSCVDPMTLHASVLLQAPFVSECGARGMPAPQSWAKLLPEPEICLGNTEFESEKIKKSFPEFHHFCMEAPQEMFLRGIKFDDIRHVTLLRLADAVNMGSAEFDKMAMEVCRTAYPQNGGLLLWAWKRPWPSIGCQLMDGFGALLPAYYAVKCACSRVLPCLKLGSMQVQPLETMKIRLFLLDDSGETARSGNLRVRLFSPDMREYRAFQFPVKEPFPEIEFIVPESFAGSHFFLILDGVKNGKSLTRNRYLMTCGNWQSVPGIRLQIQKYPAALSSEVLTMHQVDDTTEYRIKICNHGPYPAYPVTISMRNASFTAEDSWFWLDAGETRQISIWVYGENRLSLPVICAWNSPPGARGPHRMEISSN